MPTINFKGKSFVQNHHLAVKFHQLIPKKEYSMTNNVSLHDNLIIHGDNLAALKALLPTYAGKVKCIYIDPPYNTGEENWVYNDNVNSPLIKDWLGKVVDKEDLCRHEKWLCMMMPRLKLLKELLTKDGIIFISLNDVENHYCKVLCDEIFSRDNFVANIIWEKRTARDARRAFSINHDHILVYANDYVSYFDSKNLLPVTEEVLSRYTNPDNDPRGAWQSVAMTAQAGHATKDQFYTIVTPTGKKHNPPKGLCWIFTEKKFKEEVKKNNIYFPKNGDGVPRQKKFLEDRGDKGLVPLTIWSSKEVGTNDTAKKSLLEIFHDDLHFDNPKPVELIKRIIQISTSAGDIILDSFSGSGTTAHAVLDLNKEDGGSRKFILVEMEDYANKITAERIRRVINGVKSSKGENLKNGLGGTFSYFELGNPIEMESILQGKNMPSYEELSRYVFYTSTGEEFDSGKIDESKNYIGSTKVYDVYLFYKPDIEYLKNTALTLEKAESISKGKSNKKKLVFAPTKYLDEHSLRDLKIEFCQLPFEIYRIKG